LLKPLDLGDEMTYFGYESDLYQLGSEFRIPAVLYAFDDALVVAWGGPALTWPESLQDIVGFDSLPKGLVTSEVITRRNPTERLLTIPCGAVSSAVLRRSWLVGAVENHSKLVIVARGKKTTLYAEQGATVGLAKLLRSALGEQFENRRS
jgi:hypothetical protein